MPWLGSPNRSSPRLVLQVHRLPVALLVVPTCRLGLVTPDPGPCMCYFPYRCPRVNKSMFWPIGNLAHVTMFHV